MHDTFQQIARATRQPLPPVPPAPPQPVGAGRIGALLIEGMVWGVVCCAWGIFVAVLDSASPRGLPVWATSAAIVIPFLFLLLISASEVAFAASPGKWLVGLTIRTPDARRAPRGRLLLRWAIKYSSLALIACSFAVRQIAHRLWAGGYVATADLFESAASWTAVSASAAFWITFAGCFLAFLPSRRALHDLLAGTAVFQVSQLRIAETGQHGFEVSPPAPQPLDAQPAPLSR